MKSKKETIAGWRLRIWGLKRWNLIENQRTSSPMAMCYVYLIWCFHSKKGSSCQNWLIFVWTFESLKGPQTLPWPALHWEHLITYSSIVISLQLYGPLCALIFKFKLRTPFNLSLLRRPSLRLSIYLYWEGPLFFKIPMKTWILIFSSCFLSQLWFDIFGRKEIAEYFATPANLTCSFWMTSSADISWCNSISSTKERPLQSYTDIKQLGLPHLLILAQPKLSLMPSSWYRSSFLT